MSYHTQWQLTYDDPFVSRCRSCLTVQSNVYKDDGRADIAATAKAILRGAGGHLLTFQSLLAASPGFADKVDKGDGTIDSTLITDEDILSAVQADYPAVAALYFTTAGTPIT